MLIGVPGGTRSRLRPEPPLRPGHAVTIFAEPAVDRQIEHGEVPSAAFDLELVRTTRRVWVAAAAYFDDIVSRAVDAPSRMRRGLTHHNKANLGIGNADFSRRRARVLRVQAAELRVRKS